MSKVWLITGASRGLGRAFTEEALKAGHRVLATARNSEDLAYLAARFGESVHTVPLDVTNEKQARYAVEAAIQTFGGLDVLVNNAGYGKRKLRRRLRLSRTSAHRLKRIYSASLL